MARPPRIEFAGACYHIINRGNYRRRIFGGKGAAEAFERVLDEAADRFGWQIHAYVIMGNHYHLALRLLEPNLSEGMKWLQGTWVRRFNAFRGRTGRPFQGRFKSLLLEPGDALGRVCHYIHLNPVRAGIVPVANAADYPHGSLHRYHSMKNRPPWLDAEPVLSSAGDLPDSKKGWRDYLNVLGTMIGDESSRKELTAKKLSRGWCVGSSDFKKSLRDAIKVREESMEKFAGLEPEGVRIEREHQWEERLVALAAAAHVDLSKLGPRKSAPDKVLMAAALKCSTSVSNGWLAARLDMGKPASASQFVRRLLLTERGKGAVDAILSKVKT